jgi:hypothetical protein
VGAATGAAVASSRGARASTLEQEVTELRASVQDLQQQVAALKRTNTASNAGTGGSGSAGTSVKASPRTVVASVVMEGQVAAVGQDRVRVRDNETGDLYDLRLGQNTSATQGNQRIATRNIPEGSMVRAAYNLVAGGDSYATRILVLPQQQQQQPQQQRQQPQQQQR